MKNSTFPRSAALDTNIFIYAHVSDYSESQRTRKWLIAFLSECEVFYLSWPVLYEYIRIVTHPRVHKSPLSAAQALSDLMPYFQDSRCRILQETPEHLEVLSQVWKTIPSARGNFVFDCHYAALLKEHAVRTIVTADTDFLKFRFLEVVNPLLIRARSVL